MTDDVDEFGYVAGQATTLGVPPLGVRRGTATVEGRDVSFLVWGDTAPEVAFLHGAGLNAHTWDATILSLGRPAVAVDLPGHGDSSWRDDADYRPETMAPAVLAALGAAGFLGGLVVGHSLGALTALALLHLQPEIATGVVLVDMSPGIRKEDSQQVRGFLAGEQVFRSREDIVDRALAHGIGSSREQLARGVVLNTRILPSGNVIWKHHFANLSDGLEAATGDATIHWPVLENAAVPLLLIRATHGYLSPEVVGEFQRRVPLADVVEIEAGHNAHEQDPVGLATLIRDWSTRHDVLFF
ncbi:MAG: alpha/beta hydrolase fold protein [Frondihabitans sp.]|nr:alpha/beta hydrolase fold protein [Frondihabitans sp.]